MFTSSPSLTCPSSGPPQRRYRSCPSPSFPSFPSWKTSSPSPAPPRRAPGPDLPCGTAKNERAVNTHKPRGTKTHTPHDAYHKNHLLATSRSGKSEALSLKGIEDSLKRAVLTSLARNRVIDHDEVLLGRERSETKREISTKPTETAANRGRRKYAHTTHLVVLCHNGEHGFKFLLRGEDAEDTRRVSNTHWQPYP
jgi:hypothetical protein